MDGIAGFGIQHDLKDIVAIFSCPCGIIDHPPIRLVSDLPSQLANNVNHRLKMFTREVAHYGPCFRSYILLKPVPETIGSTFFYQCSAFLAAAFYIPHFSGRSLSPLSIRNLQFLPAQSAA
jgi:hypothetical protein